MSLHMTQPIATQAAQPPPGQTTTKAATPCLKLHRQTNNQHPQPPTNTAFDPQPKIPTPTQPNPTNPQPTRTNPLNPPTPQISDHPYKQPTTTPRTKHHTTENHAHRPRQLHTHYHQLSPTTAPVTADTPLATLPPSKVQIEITNGQIPLRIEYTSTRPLTSSPVITAML